MLTSEIVSRFNLQVDDDSELSTEEGVALAQEVYDEVANDRGWEWLKAQGSGNTSTSVPYVALPSDFKELTQNKDDETIVFVGTELDEYKVIPYSSRRDYRDIGGFCYLDIPNSRLVFTLQPTEVKAIEYDYIKIPPLLTSTTEPLVKTTSFGNMIAYGMASRFPSIEGADKGNSYATDNRKEYEKILSDLRLQDANIKVSI